MHDQRMQELFERYERLRAVTESLIGQLRAIHPDLKVPREHKDIDILDQESKRVAPPVQGSSLYESALLLESMPKSPS